MSRSVISALRHDFRLGWKHENVMFLRTSCKYNLNRFVVLGTTQVTKYRHYLDENLSK